MVNGALLGDEIRAAVDAVVSTQPVDRVALFRAIGNAIAAHFVANAVVTIPFVTAVQPGLGTSGPGTGSLS